MHPSWTVYGLLLALCIAATGQVAGLTLHVSPDGDDAAADGPLASLTGARDRLRALRAAGLAEPVEIVVADGVYLLDEPFRLTAEDSGTAAAPVVYRAADGASPRFQGGRRVTGFRVEDGVWRTTIPAAAGRAWPFAQLWVNGRRATRARHPNVGYLRTVGQLPGFENPGQHRGNPDSCRGFQFAPGDVRADWHNRDDVGLFVYFAWTNALCFIDQVDEDNQRVTFSNRTGWPVGYWEANRTRYYVDNCLEALDAPGEWYLDRETGELYYRPRDGEDPATAEVVAPVLESLVQFAGDPALGLPVAHVTLRGLTFEYADLRVRRDQEADGQAAVFLGAALHTRGAVDCVFERCTIAHVGGYGVWFDEGSQRNRLQTCEVTDLGGGGVRLGTGGTPASPELAADGNTIDNCFIHDGGHVFPAGCGLIIQRASHNTVTHNEICDFRYTGLSVGWSWGYAESTAHHNVLEYNHVHHLGWGELSDMGGVYTLGDSPGTRVNRNVFHDILSYDYGGWGLYTDEGSTGIEMAHNVVYNTRTGGFHQHYGRDNRIHDNVLAFSATHQLQRTRNEEHNSFFFERNLVLFDNGILLGGNWDNSRFVSDRNLYWDLSGEWTEEDLAAWRAAGDDVNSVVADPRVADAAARDFRFGGDSPAAALGIDPVDPGEVGLYGDADWVRRPTLIQRPAMVFERPAPPEPIVDGFETTPVGQIASLARTSGEERGASIRVTDETAASGTRSLKFTDAPGLEHAWQPHLYYSPGVRAGLTTLRFAARTDPGATWYCEWRDNHNPYRVGPTLTVTADGRLTVAGRALLTVPQGRWFRLSMTCGLGRQATGDWTLTVELPGAAPQRFDGLPIADGFRRLDWLGWSSLATDTTVFFVDDVELRWEE